MDLGAGAARTRVTHLPKVVFFITFQDAILRQMLFPEIVGFLIEGCTIFLVTRKNGGIETVLVQLHHLRQKLPRVGDSLFLEIVAERPVAQHLEHGVVVGVATHLLQVIMLAGDAETLLGVGHARVFGRIVAQKDVLELVHASIGEHQRRVILDDHRCGWDNMMLFGFKKAQKSSTDFCRSHIRKI